MYLSRWANVLIRFWYIAAGKNANAPWRCQRMVDSEGEYIGLSTDAPTPQKRRRDGNYCSIASGICHQRACVVLSPAPVGKLWELLVTRWSISGSNYSCSRCVSQDEVNLAVVMLPPITHHLAVPPQHSKTRTWQWIGSLFTDYHLHFEIFCLATGDYLFTAQELVKFFCMSVLVSFSRCVLTICWLSLHSIHAIWLLAMGCPNSGYCVQPIFLLL